MPDFILPAEADHCPHCNAVLRDPPDCCEAMAQEHSEEMHRQNQVAADRFERETQAWREVAEYYPEAADDEYDHYPDDVGGEA